MHRPFLAALLTVFLNVSAHAADPTPISIADLLKVQHVGGIAVSPDGSRVAYSLTQPRNVLKGEKTGTARRHLYVSFGPDTSRAFVTGSVSVGQIQFKPDGRTISFVAKMKGDKSSALYGIPIDGGAQTKLYDHGASIGGYAWAPDGETLYVIADTPETAAAEALREQGFNAKVYEESSKPTKLWQVDLSKDAAVAEPISVNGHPSRIHVSKDGKSLLVRLTPTALVDDDLMRSRLTVLNARNGKVRHVVETPGKIGGYAFAPDGNRIALTAGVDVNDPAATTLYMANIKEKSLTEIRSGAFAVMDVDWHGEDQLLALVHEGEGSRIETLDTSGQLLASAPQDGNVVHALYTAADRIVASVSAPSHPRALFEFAENKLTRWTQHNSWTEDKVFAEARSYSFTARDGQSVSGVLVEPLNRKKKRRVPLLLMVHGGPEAHDSNGWNTSYGKPSQIAAGRGYAVFMPNYRGSTGRGTAFSKQHQGDYAGKEFNDLVDAVKALVEDGLVDESRVGITGGSYGGYASGWAATKLTEHFAASVMFVGISNQISKFGTTDIPNEMYLVHSRKWPWEDWQGMLDVSPIAYAGQSKTPTLILHGEEDTRVHPSQSFEMYRNLKLRGQAPVRLVLYPGEGHGNRKAAAQIDYALRLMRWMDHFVRDEKKDIPPYDLYMLDGMMTDKSKAKSR